MFALTGLFHGSAFGASIAGQEIVVGSSVLIGYLLGLGIIQYMIIIITGNVAITIWKATEATAVSVRMSGAFVTGIGVFLALEEIEGTLNRIVDRAVRREVEQLGPHRLHHRIFFRE